MIGKIKTWGCRSSLKATLFIVVGSAAVFFGYKEVANLSIKDGVLIATAVLIFWYSWETMRMVELTEYQTVLQTELTTMPILGLYIRLLSGVKDEETRRSLSENYAITEERDGGIRPSNYYIALRSMGTAPAFNVTVTSDNFVVGKYQTRFFGPNGDEHAVKIIRKPHSKVRGVEELNDEVFIVECQSAFGKKYTYKYKIVDIGSRTIEFLSQAHAATRPSFQAGKGTGGCD